MSQEMGTLKHSFSGVLEDHVVDANKMGGGMESIIETILKFDENLAVKFGNDTKVTKIIVSDGFFRRLELETQLSTPWPIKENFSVAPKTIKINTYRTEIEIVKDG